MVQHVGANDIGMPNPENYNAQEATEKHWSDLSSEQKKEIIKHVALAVAGIALVILGLGGCAALMAVGILFCPPLAILAPFVGGILAGHGASLAIKSIQNAQNAMSKHLAAPTTNIEILDVEALRIVAEGNGDEIVETR